MCADWIGLVVLFATSALIFSKLVRLLVGQGGTWEGPGRSERGLVLGREGSGLVFRVKG